MGVASCEHGVCEGRALRRRQLPWLQCSGFGLHTAHCGVPCTASNLSVPRDVKTTAVWSESQGAASTGGLRGHGRQVLPCTAPCAREAGELPLVAVTLSM